MESGRTVRAARTHEYIYCSVTILAVAPVTSSRTVPVPPDRAFSAWVEPDQIEAWLRPPGYTAMGTSCPERNGGDGLRFDFRHPEEGTVRLETAPLAIEPPRRLAFTMRGHGGPLETGNTRVDVELAAVDDSTLVAVSQREFASDEAREFFAWAWPCVLERLEEVLSLSAPRPGR